MNKSKNCKLRSEIECEKCRIDHGKCTELEAELQSNKTYDCCDELRMKDGYKLSNKYGVKY